MRQLKTRGDKGRPGTLSDHSSAPAATRVVMDNGVTVLLEETHHLPLVSFQAYVRVGSIYEENHLGSGISHFVEHTIDGGTERRNHAQIDEIVETIGNLSNAYTTKDHTQYYITTSTVSIEPALDVLSDYLTHPIFPPIEVEIQRGVIQNELNSDLDDPIQLLHDLLYETAFRTHPVRFPVGGSSTLLRGLTRENLVEFYQQHYVANNLILVAAGDFNSQEMIDRIAHFFGNFPDQPSSTFELPDEPSQSAPRRAERIMDVELGYLAMGYHTVEINHRDGPTLDIISTLMGSGESSRLVKILKDQRQISHTMQVWSETPHYGAGYFGVDLEAELKTLETAETSVLEQIERLKSEQVTESELRRAKTIDTSEYLFALGAIEERSTILGIDELTTGDCNYHQKHLRKLQAVTSEDVQRVARTYFRNENLTTVVIRPHSGKPSIVNAGLQNTISATTSDSHTENTELKTIAPTQNIEASKTCKNRKPTPRKQVLSNGLRLLTKSVCSAPVVSIQALFSGGTRFETEATNGTFCLMSNLLLKGTRNRTSDDIFASIEAMGGNISVYSGEQTFGIGLNLLKGDLEYGLKLLADILLNPGLEEEELQKLKTEAIVNIRAESDDWYALGKQQFLETMFQIHPNRLRSCGSISSLTGLAATDIWNCFRRYCTPNNMVLAVYGDLQPHAVRTITQRCFEAFQPTNLKFPRVPIEPPLNNVRRIERHKELAQAIIFQGFVGVPLQHSDREIVEVLSSLLFGVGYPGGRMYKRLRHKELVYYIHGDPYFGLDQGYIAICASTMPENIESVLEQIDDEILSVQQIGISNSELARGKQMCITAYLTSTQTASSQASTDALDELHGLGFDYSQRYISKIESVTIDAVQHAATKYLTCAKRVISIVRPQS